MNNSNHFIVFSLDRHLFAIKVSSIRRITRAVSITPLPKSPKIVMGIMDLQGEIIPVVNVRKRFGLKEKPIQLNNHFIIGKTRNQNVAIVVDEVTDIIESPEDAFTDKNKIVKDVEHIAGVLKLKNGMVLIQDIDTFLSLEEEDKILKSIKKLKK